MFYKTFYPSPIGNLTLGSDGDNLVGLWIEGQKYYEDTVDEEMIHRDDVPVFDETRAGQVFQRRRAGDISAADVAHRR